MSKTYHNQMEILNEARRHSQAAGFSVVTRNSSKSTLYLMCACGGQPRRKNKPRTDAGGENRETAENGDAGDSDSGRRSGRKRVSIRCGCPFLLGANLRRDGLWHVSKLDDRHNHTLVSHPYIYQIHKHPAGNSPPKTTSAVPLSPKKSTPEREPTPLMDDFIPDLPSPLPLYLPSFDLPPANERPLPPADEAPLPPAAKKSSPPVAKTPLLPGLSLQPKEVLKDIFNFIYQDYTSQGRDVLLQKIQEVLNSHVDKHPSTR